MRKNRFISILLNLIILFSLLIFLPASKVGAQIKSKLTNLSNSVGQLTNQDNASLDQATETHYYFVDAFTLIPHPDNTVGYSTYYGVKCNPDSAYQYYDIPIYLPDHVNITGITAWVIDNDPSNDIGFYVLQSNLDSNISTFIGFVTSYGKPVSTAFTKISDIPMNPLETDLMRYSYYVEAYLPPGCQAGISSFRIDYTYANSLADTQDEPASLSDEPGGPGFYSSSALGFMPYPNNSTTPYAHFGMSIYNPDTVTHAYEIPVYLPQGATITKFTIWAYDNDSTNNLSVKLMTKGMENSVFNIIMAENDSTGAEDGVRIFKSTSVFFPKIDMENAVYWVEAILPPGNNLKLFSFQIDYAYFTYAPLIVK